MVLQLLLCVYNITISLNIFIGPLTVRTRGSLTLVPSLGTFFLLLGAVSNFDMHVFASFYYNIFYQVWLLSLGGLSFSNERQKGS